MAYQQLKKLKLKIAGRHWANWGVLIERQFMKILDVRKVDAYFGSGKVRAVHPGEYSGANTQLTSLHRLKPHLYFNAGRIALSAISSFGKGSFQRHFVKLAGAAFLFFGFIVSANPQTPTSTPTPAEARDVPADMRTAIEVITKEYILKHPEVIQKALNELQRREQAAEGMQRQAAVKENAATIFSSPHQVVLGNPQGDVTMVEFFDYNCQYCRRALSDMVALLKSDPKLKVVLKEFPILGDGSTEAATVAIAVRMQDESGKKYLEFHQKLLGGRGQADRAHALAVAKEAGVDMARLERDMTSPEIKATIDENLKLAQAIGASGTPTYVVGKEVVVGAIGLDGLKEKINAARH